MSSQLVVAAGVPHVPVFPALAADGDADIIARYATVARALELASPDLLIVVASDHINTFFLDRMPTFALAVDGTTNGPVDDVPGITCAPLPADPAAAAAVADNLLAAGFDLLLCREADVDHSVVVPLHFLNTSGLPVLVMNVNAYVSPMPSARRCHDLGVALAAAVARLPGSRRVGLIASGSFSQEVGGARIDAGRTWSVPRPEWATYVSKAFAADDVESILQAATPQALADAGTVAGEVLPWLTVVGAAGRGGAGLRPMVDHRPGDAYAFVAWT